LPRWTNLSLGWMSKHISVCRRHLYQASNFPWKSLPKITPKREKRSSQMNAFITRAQVGDERKRGIVGTDQEVEGETRRTGGKRGRERRVHLGGKRGLCYQVWKKQPIGRMRTSCKRKRLNDLGGEWCGMATLEDGFEGEGGQKTKHRKETLQGNRLAGKNWKRGLRGGESEDLFSCEMNWNSKRENRAIRGFA